MYVELRWLTEIVPEMKMWNVGVIAGVIAVIIVLAIIITIVVVDGITIVCDSTVVWWLWYTPSKDTNTVTIDERPDKNA